MTMIIKALEELSSNYEKYTLNQAQDILDFAKDRALKQSEDLAALRLAINSLEDAIFNREKSEYLPF